MQDVAAGTNKADFVGFKSRSYGLGKRKDKENISSRWLYDPDDFTLTPAQLLSAHWQSADSGGFCLKIQM